MTATMVGETPCTVYKGAAVLSERSGRWELRTFYIWATSEEKALEIAKRTFPQASKIVVRKRGG